ncbi:uncharacterized protein LOC127789506 isoform X2 [Diospyros lotus]|uniref:uncharacterized protein LOC127789506 isoform X2 n=1 Tax=Diospyros lotus TaxID=55363 RepID=UPI002254B91D|nr:uncharacterized protein LOC127789506 isoform X2 [Diospyros lotus]
MAACNFGASSVKCSNLNLGFVSTKLGKLQVFNGLKSGTPAKFQSLIITKSAGKALIGCKCSSKCESVTNLEPASKEEKSPGTTSQIIPNLDEVKFLLTQMCDTASIAEFELKLGGFRLYVTRKLEAKSEPPPPPVSVSVPVSVSTPDRAPDQNGTVSAPSLAISKSVPSSGGIRTLLDKAADEGLVIIQSPRVGYFRRSRTIKGKRAPPSCKEKQIVKEGQVLCYIEQLGGEIPIESDISGEVVKILHEDGDPVGYGDSLIAILPSFPGIKKLQ